MTDGEKLRRIRALKDKHYNAKKKSDVPVFDGRVDMFLSALNVILGR